MAGPTPNDVHVDSTQSTDTKPKPKLSNKQLAAILQRIASLMAEGDSPPSNPLEVDPKPVKLAPKSDTQKPYPSEHAARQHDPKDYTEIRRKNDAFGPGISVIYGIKNGKTEVQSLRFSADRFTIAQAKQWLIDHKYSIGSLEAATPTSKVVGLQACVNCGKEVSVADMQLINNEALCPTCATKAMNEADTSLDDMDAENLTEDYMAKAEVTIFAKADEQQIAYGVSYPAKPLGWSDTQGDWVAPAEIERMAHNYLLKSRQYDINHARLASYDEAQIVESYIAPVDFTLNGHAITKGSWVVATYFPKPETWAAVKAGQINAYSIKGRGKRTPLNPTT